MVPHAEIEPVTRGYTIPSKLLDHEACTSLRCQAGSPGLRQCVPDIGPREQPDAWSKLSAINGIGPSAHAIES